MADTSTSYLLAASAAAAVRCALAPAAYRWAGGRGLSARAWAAAMVLCPSVTLIMMAVRRDGAQSGRGGSFLERLLSPFDPDSPLSVGAALIAAVLISAISTVAHLAFALYIAGRPVDFSQTALEDALLSPAGLLASTVILDGALFALAFVRSDRPGRNLSAWAGLRAVKIQTFLAAVGAGLLAVVASSSLIQYVQSELGFSGGSAFPVPGDYSGLALVLTSAGLVAPIGEELFFRGYAFRGMSRTVGWAAAAGLSAAMFALVHLEPVNILPIFATGLVLAYVAHRTQSILPCIAIHALNNTAAVLLAFHG